MGIGEFESPFHAPKAQVLDQTILYSQTVRAGFEPAMLLHSGSQDQHIDQAMLSHQ